MKSFRYVYRRLIFSLDKELHDLQNRNQEIRGRNTYDFEAHLIYEANSRKDMLHKVKPCLKKTAPPKKN